MCSTRCLVRQRMRRHGRPFLSWCCCQLRSSIVSSHKWFINYLEMRREEFLTAFEIYSHYLGSSLSYPSSSKFTWLYISAFSHIIDMRLYAFHCIQKGSSSTALPYAEIGTYHWTLRRMFENGSQSQTQPAWSPQRRQACLEGTTPADS